MKKEKEKLDFVTHEFEPVYDEHSKILILGTFPSVKSRQNQFYYGHPQNRFWRVLSNLMETSLPESIEEKKKFLLSNHIAVWDVIASCEIHGSSDSSIRNVKPVQIERILSASPIKQIFTNGNKAHTLYQKYLLPVTGKESILLPSTSPANAAYSMERLLECWNVIKGAMVDTKL